MLYFEAKADDDQEVRNIPEELQRLIEGGITKSLDANLTGKFDNVPMGKVVQLLGHQDAVLPQDRCHEVPAARTPA